MKKTLSLVALCGILTITCAYSDAETETHQHISSRNTKPLLLDINKTLDDHNHTQHKHSDHNHTQHKHSDHNSTITPVQIKKASRLNGFFIERKDSFEISKEREKEVKPFKNLKKNLAPHDDNEFHWPI